MRLAASEADVADDGEFFADFSARFGLPLAQEQDALCLGRLRSAELKAELASLDKAASPAILSRRGRLKRLLGDTRGARRDYRAALRGDAQASVWLCELDLSAPGTEARLSRVLSRAPGRDLALLHRGAGRLLRRRHADAIADLALFAGRRPASAAGRLLLGLARHRSGGDPAADYARAAENRLWAAPHMLLAAFHAGKSSAISAADEALDCDPNYAHVLASQYQPGANLDELTERLVVLACAQPERFAGFGALQGFYREPFPSDLLASCLALRDLRPARAWSWALLGRALLRGPSDAARAREALAALDRAVSLKPRAGWVYAWRAMAFLATNELERALADFDECAARQPFYGRAYAWRGALLRKLGRTREAVADLGRAIEMDPDYHFGWRQRSLARREAGDLGAAAEDLGRAYRLQPKYEWGAEDTAGGEPKDLAAAASEIGGEIERTGGTAALFAWRGRVKLTALDSNGALADFQAALKLDSACALARGWLGQACLLAKRFKPARLQLRRALKRDPGFWTLRLWLASAEFESGRPREALAVLRRLLRIRPRTDQAHALMADYYLRSGDFKNAAAEAEKSMAINGRSGRAPLLAARARFELGDVRTAELRLAQAARIVHDSPELRALRDLIDGRMKAGTGRSKP